MRTRAHAIVQKPRRPLQTRQTRLTMFLTGKLVGDDSSSPREIRRRKSISDDEPAHNAKKRKQQNLTIEIAAVPHMIREDGIEQRWRSSIRPSPHQRETPASINDIDTTTKLPIVPPASSPLLSQPSSLLSSDLILDQPSSPRLISADASNLDVSESKLPSYFSLDACQHLSDKPITKAAQMLLAARKEILRIRDETSSGNSDNDDDESCKNNGVKEARKATNNAVTKKSNIVHCPFCATLVPSVCQKSVDTMYRHMLQLMPLPARPRIPLRYTVQKCTYINDNKNNPFLWHATNSELLKKAIERVCGCHRREQVLREAQLKDWPTPDEITILIETLPQRIRALKNRLDEIISGATTSHYCQKLVDIVKLKGSSYKTVKNFEQRHGHLRPGYYGHKGGEVIMEVLAKLYIYTANPLSIEQTGVLSIAEFLHEVLMPETAVMLILEDCEKRIGRPVSLTEAREIKDGSAEYGDVYFS